MKKKKFLCEFSNKQFQSIRESSDLKEEGQSGNFFKEILFWGKQDNQDNDDINGNVMIKLY